MQMMTIIDYGIGNVASVLNALTSLKIPAEISCDPADLEKATALILPGVGAAGEGMKNLKNKKLDMQIKDLAKKGIPLLGICLGMQLLFTFSEEGNVDCLDIIEGKVKKIPIKTGLKVPQIGWNQVEKKGDSKLLKGIKNKSYFYFVNSYYCSPNDKTVAMGLTEYGENFCSILEKENIFGVQFHPEKSGEVGLQLLKNFWEAAC